MVPVLGQEQISALEYLRMNVGLFLDNHALLTAIDLHTVCCLIL